MRKASLLLLAALVFPSCASLPSHEPPPTVSSQSDLDALNAKIDALTGKITGTLSAAATGNIPAAAAHGAESATGVLAIAREYGVSIPDVLLAVLMSLGGVRYWRGSTSRRKGYAPAFPPVGSTKP